MIRRHNFENCPLLVDAAREPRARSPPAQPPMVPLLAAAAAAATLVHAASGATTSPPHLVFVLGDDVGHGDVGYVDPAVISPRIDELARSGVRFGRHYSYMWCAPSRSALMTGRLPPHNGVYSGASGAYFALSLGGQP